MPERTFWGDIKSMAPAEAAEAALHYVRSSARKLRRSRDLKGAIEDAQAAQKLFEEQGVPSLGHYARGLELLEKDEIPEAFKEIYSAFRTELNPELKNLYRPLTLLFYSLKCMRGEDHQVLDKYLKGEIWQKGGARPNP